MVSLSQASTWFELVRFATIYEDLKWYSGNTRYNSPNKNIVKTQLSKGYLKEIPIHSIICLFKD